MGLLYHADGLWGSKDAVKRMAWRDSVLLDYGYCIAFTSTIRGLCESLCFRSEQASPMSACHMLLLVSHG